MKTRTTLYLGAALAAFALAILIGSTPALAGGAETRCEARGDVVTEDASCHADIRVRDGRSDASVECEIAPVPPFDNPADVRLSFTITEILTPEEVMSGVMSRTITGSVSPCGTDTENGDTVCDFNSENAGVNADFPAPGDNLKATLTATETMNGTTVETTVMIGVPAPPGMDDPAAVLFECETKD